MQLFSSKNIPKLVIILPILSIIFTSLFITLTTIYSIKQNFKEDKKIITQKFMSDLQKTTKQRVELAYNIIDALYQINKNSPNSYQKTIYMMQKILDKLRWDKKGYIFVFDYKGNTLFHINKYYMTINRWNWERHGVKVIRNIILAALKNPEGTYIKYLAYNPGGRPIDKVSYVKVYKPLKIIIGNGVYLDYLNKELLEKQQNQEKLLNRIIKNILVISTILSLIIIAIMYIFSKKIKDIFQNYEKELKNEKQKLFIQANFDNLTHLHNREHFLLELKEALLKLKRKNTKLAVLFVDIDHFKEINDTKGHDIGDKVLQNIALRLKENVRESDVVARFGGDEFVILLEDIDEDKIVEVAQRILNDIKQPIIIDNLDYYISASIGISIAPDDTEDIHNLIKYADIAMYKSKKEGKDRFNFYNNSMTKEVNNKLTIKHEIHKALKNDEFRLYFQPQIDKNNNLTGMEVLIRWQHPKKGLLTPDKFLPIAIEFGIIDKIDLWVIENSIIQYKKWQKQGFQPGVISCNVTIYQIEKGALDIELAKLLEKYDFDPKNLNLEITEEGIMKNPEKSIIILNKIKQLGININIDDFGTGYSSLTYLKKLPISKLKIDRSFIKDIPNDKDDVIITKTIISLAKNLNLKIIAEGVETQEQKEFVFNNGCENIQGYFYSPPVPTEEFEKKFLI